MGNRLSEPATGSVVARHGCLTRNPISRTRSPVSAAFTVSNDERSIHPSDATPVGAAFYHVERQAIHPSIRCNAGRRGLYRDEQRAINPSIRSDGVCLARHREAIHRLPRSLLMRAPVARLPLPTLYHSMVDRLHSYF